MKDKFELFIFVMLAAIFLSTAYAIIKTAHAYSLEPKQTAATWKPRQIPVCDKELWLRIKDGC